MRAFKGKYKNQGRACFAGCFRLNRFIKVKPTIASGFTFSMV